MDPTSDDMNAIRTMDTHSSNSMSFMVSPVEEQRNFSMLETASASHSDDGTKYETAVLPYRPSSSSDTSSVNFADSLLVLGKQRPSGRGAAAALNLFARENLGLLVNYMAIGAIHGLFQAITYPYLNIYLNIDDSLASSAERWLAIPWMGKLVFAMLSDGIPIKGSRRRAYMFLGWSICLLFTLIMAVMPSETPYLTHRSVTNPSAAGAGPKYVVMFVLATFGYVLADTASDGMLVEFAQLQQANEHQQLQHDDQERELQGHMLPHSLSSERGSGLVAVITTLFAARYSAQGFMLFLVALLCNSESYGGDFAWGASVNTIVVLGVLISAGALAATWFLLVEDESPAGDHVHIRLPREWKQIAQKLCHQRAIGHLMAYMFLSRLCFTYYATSAKAVYELWAPASPLLTNLFSSFHAAVFAGTAMLLRQGPTVWNIHKLGWRQLVAVSVVVSAALWLLLALLTVYNVIRIAAFTLFMEQLIALFEAVAYFVALFAAVATAEPGLEATSLSLMLTLGNLAVPFAMSLSQAIGEHFDVYDAEYKADSEHARAQAMYCFLVAVFIRALHLLLLPLLPQCAEAARALKLSQFTGRKGSLIVLTAAVCTVFLILWALLTALLSSFQHTSCLNIAGGEGC